MITDVFTEQRTQMLNALSSQVAVSLENARHFEHLDKLYRRTERFIPKRFIQLLNKENIEEVELGDSVEKQISALFNDIRNFTSIIEKKSPDEAFKFVNRYWQYMAPIIRKYGGYIDQYQGDAILAIFATSTDDAVNAAIAMMQALIEFNKKQLELHEAEIDMGLALSTGPAMLGIIGEEERQVSGLISDAVNTAARIEGLNKMYGSHILLSESAMNHIKSPETFKIRLIFSITIIKTP